MASDVTLRDEYQMLVGELRQNRQIQLQAFATTPVWLGVFFGLLGARNDWNDDSALLLLAPIPLIFVNTLLILDRRGSSDYILGYLRTAIDQQLGDRPGWNHLLPAFRRTFSELRETRESAKLIPQRFDFNVIMLLSFLLMSLTCCVLLASVNDDLTNIAIIVGLVVVAVYALAFRHVLRQAARKGRILAAWQQVLDGRSRPI